MSPKIPNAAHLMSYVKEPQLNYVETLCLAYGQMAESYVSTVVVPWRLAGVTQIYNHNIKKNTF